MEIVAFVFRFNVQTDLLVSQSDTSILVNCPALDPVYRH